MDFHREFPAHYELEGNTEVKLVNFYRAFIAVSDSTNEKPLSLHVCHREAWLEGIEPASSRQSLSDENAAMYALNKSQPAENV